MTSPEVVESLIKDIAQQATTVEQQHAQFYKVLIVNINDKALECPGMVPEDKFLSDKRLVHQNYNDISSSESSGGSFFFRNKGKKTSGNGGQQASSGTAATKGTHSGSGTLIKANKSGERRKLVNGIAKKHDISNSNNNKEDEVRSRHDGDDDDCESVSSNDEDDLADDLDVASNLAAAHRHHNVVDIEDEIEDEANHIRRVVVGDDEEDEDDDLSEFDNLSNRDTPIISGRDTPSSHSHDDLLNVSTSRQHHHQQSHHQAGQGSANAGSQVNSQFNSSLGGGLNAGGGSGPNGLHQTNLIGGSMQNGGGGGAASRGPQLPVTAQKPNSEDINDKFCKFEINKSKLGEMSRKIEVIEFPLASALAS